MLIEKIIEIELRKHEHPGGTNTTGYFHDKTKVFKENL